MPDGLVGLTQTQIAPRLGASREKVNRRLHEWAKDGLVSVERSGVRIVRSGQLKALPAKAWPR